MCVYMYLYVYIYTYIIWVVSRMRARQFGIYYTQASNNKTLLLGDYPHYLKPPFRRVFPRMWVYFHICRIPASIGAFPHIGEHQPTGGF